MYAFLVKKIAIPGNQKVKTLAWNPEHGWLACGGDDGLLKVLKLDAAAGKEAPTSGGVRGVAAAINLSGNTTLVGHRGSVCVATWNAEHRKLTTADSNGLIIVWVPHKGAWLEDMINNRGKSVVRDMRWRSNGEEICIAYEDGHVILGGVDGTRRWHKDLGIPLTHVEWAPDGRWLLFASGEGGVTVYTQQGARIGSLELHALADLAVAPADGSGPAVPPRVPVAALEWYDGAEGYAYPDIPCLAVAFENGRVQLMREADDPKPVLLDTGLRLSQCKWNTSGTVLAVAGTRAVAAGAAAGGAGARDVAEVQFYTPFGRYVTSMKVLGGSVSSLSWEGGGLRMAVSAPPSCCCSASICCIGRERSFHFSSGSHKPRTAIFPFTYRFLCSWASTRSSSLPTSGQPTSGQHSATAWSTHSRGRTRQSNASSSGTSRRTSGAYADHALCGGASDACPAAASAD